LAIAERYQKKTMVTLRGMEAFHQQDADKRNVIVAQGLQQVDAIVALSEELKSTGDSFSGKPDKSIVISNGVDTDSFYYIARENARKKLGLPIDQDYRIILGVGALIHRKGFDLVLDALPALVKKYPRLKYYILGSEGPEGNYRAALKAKVVEKNLEKVVVFVGAVENSSLVNWYNSSDLFCLSSRGEGSPNVLSEALACGCPAVTTDVGSAKKIIERETRLGICVEPNSVVALTNGLLTVLRGKHDRSDNAKRYGVYDWTWCAQLVFPVYQQLVATHEPKKEM